MGKQTLLKNHVRDSSCDVHLLTCKFIQTQSLKNTLGLPVWVEKEWTFLEFLPTFCLFVAYAKCHTRVNIYTGANKNVTDAARAVGIWSNVSKWRSPFHILITCLTRTQSEQSNVRRCFFQLPSYFRQRILSTRDVGILIKPVDRQRMQN